MAYLTTSPLDPARLLESVRDPAHGAAASFVGVVRNRHQGRAVLRLEYSAYLPMAEAECARIVAEAEARWPVKVLLQHRIGTLEIGDAAVAIAVGAAHRDSAFEACRWVIDTVKQRVPIWKREHYAEGPAGWIDPAAPAGTSP